MPIAKRGRAKAAILTLNPMAEIIHAVMVVPILAPIMTPILCTKVIRPALTKLTTITVVALELWMSAVIKIPVNTPMTLLRVMEDRIPLRRSPANFSRPSLMIFIPYRKRASEPIRLKRLINVSIVYCFKNMVCESMYIQICVRNGFVTIVLRKTLRSGT